MAFGTTDYTNNTDKQGLGIGSPHTCEVRDRPRWKHPFQARPSVKSVESVVKTTAVSRLMGWWPLHSIEFRGKLGGVDGIVLFQVHLAGLKFLVRSADDQPEHLPV